MYDFVDTTENPDYYNALNTVLLVIYFRTKIGKMHIRNYNTQL